ncbi:unnamed protein product [Diabrotica balteata]|uniref:PiggyBac transposable element-derived protein 4 n=1 Tax=Diabrotica balteata TaxID=107213 RepID=A0A9N9X506_DIABA|nr:unnamed protein product [Diabrotica balteata]
MPGIDCSDQMISYYSSPRKSIRWYKKVMFDLLDISLWNAFYTKRTLDTQLSFLQFREEIVKEYVGIDKDEQDGSNLAKTGLLHSGKRPRLDQQIANRNTDSGMHFIDKIPNSKDPNNSYHLICKHCTSRYILKETKYLSLCVEPCFEDYHRQYNFCF